MQENSHFPLLETKGSDFFQKQTWCSQHYFSTKTTLESLIWMELKNVKKDFVKPYPH